MDLQNAQSIANDVLLEKAIKAKKVREKRVEKAGCQPIPIRQWVLICHKDKHKVQLQYYGLYKVIWYHTLGTYLLEDHNGNILHCFIKSDRLINVRIPKKQTPMIV